MSPDTPLEDEVLADLARHFHGNATLAQLCGWFGELPAKLLPVLDGLVASGRLYRVGSRRKRFSLTAPAPCAPAVDLCQCRRQLALGQSLSTAARAVGVLSRDLDVALWRSLGERGAL